MSGLLAVVAASVAAGSAILGRTVIARSRLAHLAMAFPTGLAALACCALSACTLGLQLSRGLVLGLCGLGLAAGVLFGRRWPSAWGWPRPASPLERYALAAAVLALVLILTTSLTTPLVSVDARILWTYHARLIADTGVYPAPELRDPHFLIAHPRYPPLLPMGEALTAIAAGGVDERALRTLATLFAIATAALLFAELPGRDPRLGLLLAASFALMPTLVVFEEGGADSGVADAPFACLVLGSTIALARGSPLVAGFLAAAAALTKNEGLVLGGLLCAAACFPPRRPARFGLRMTGVFAALVIPWLVVRAELAPGADEGYLARLATGGLVAGLPRALDLAAEMLKTAFLLPHRAGLLPWLVVAFWATSERRRAALVEGRFWIVLVYLGVVWLLYVVSPWQGVIQVQLSFPRILLQVMPLMLWALSQPAIGGAPSR